MADQAPQNQPRHSKLLWTIMIVTAAIVLTLVPLLLWIAYASRNTQFVLSPQGLQVRGSMYGRLIPRDHLLAPQARLVNLGTDSSLALASRTNGTSLPGYKEGWFRLTGGSKALVFVTQPDAAVYIPTTDDYAVLLSPVRPEIFLEALRSGGAVTQTFRIAPSSTSPVIFVLLAVLVPLLGLIPVVAMLIYVARQGRALPQPIGPDVLYADRLVEITHDAIEFRVYYFPGGAKRLMLSEIEYIQPFPLTTTAGKWRIWGTGDFRTWWPADWDRPSRDRAFLLIRRNKWARIVFTVEDPVQVEGLLRGLGLIREPGTREANGR